MRWLNNLISTIIDFIVVRREKSNIFFKKENQIKKTSEDINVYFFPGMAYSCSCFDNIILPKGFRKVYVEWIVPKDDEIFSDYCKRISQNLDKNNPIILIGYSFGGFVVQEIANCHNVVNLIIISTIKSEKEIPQLFKTAKKIDFANLIPSRLYDSPNLLANIFNKYIYKIPSKIALPYFKMTDPVYIKWAIKNAYEWVPPKSNKNIFHIHGSKDQIFPIDNLDEFFSIKGGDHLMVLKRGKKISKIIEKVLTKSY